MKPLERLSDLIRNNTGYSSKSFVMVIGQLVTAFIGMCVGVYILSAIFTQTVLNWFGIAAALTALGTFVLAFAWGKVKAEKYEHYPDEDENKEGGF